MNTRRPGTAASLLLGSAAVLLVAGRPLPASQKAPAVPSSVQLRVDGLSLAYNLDHEQALVLLRRAVALAPSDSAPHRALASVLWLNILFRRGTVTVDHYLGALTRSSIDLPKPPADIDAELKDHIQRAIALAEIQVSAHPKDAQAHYDLGAALGLQASYVATIEGRMLAGFRAARRSFDEEEQVLALDPSRSEAGLIIGTYRYVVSTLSLPMRMMAYVAGFGGGRASAIQMLQRTAETGSGTAGLDAQRNARAGVGNDARTDAMFALVLVYNRERQYNEAFRVLQDLRRLYPRNRLLLLEAGATQLRAGHAQQADDLLSEGLTMLARDQRARIPGEESLWRYKRGAARAALGRLDLAVADLQTATAAGAPLWVSGRARVELGRLALTRGDPVQAAANARQAEASCERGNDPECVRQAHALLRSTLGR